MTLKIQIKKTSDTKTPFYAHKGDSGVDLYAAEEHLLGPMERKLVPTGIRIVIPYGYENTCPEIANPNNVIDGDIKQIIRQTPS